MLFITSTIHPKAKSHVLVVIFFIYSETVINCSFADTRELSDVVLALEREFRTFTFISPFKDGNQLRSLNPPLIFVSTPLFNDLVFTIDLLFKLSDSDDVLTDSFVRSIDSWSILRSTLYETMLYSTSGIKTKDGFTKAPGKSFFNSFTLSISGRFLSSMSLSFFLASLDAIPFFPYSFSI